MQIFSVLLLLLLLFIPGFTSLFVEWNQNRTPSPISLTGSSVACAQDLCYVTGGYDVAGNVNDFTASYNVTSDIWDTSINGNMEPISAGRGNHASVIVWTSPSTYLVWVIGGQISIESGPQQMPNSDPNPDPPGCPNCPAFLAISDVEYYDPSLGFWQDGPSIECSVPPSQQCDLQLGLSNGITKLTCASYGTEIYCMGGLGVRYPDTGGGEFVPNHNVAYLQTADPNAVWLFSIAADGPAPLPISIFQHSLAIYGSKIYLTGGGCYPIQGNCGDVEFPPSIIRSTKDHQSNQISTIQQSESLNDYIPFNCDDNTVRPGGAYASNNTWVFDMANTTNGWNILPVFMNHWRCAHGSFVDPNGFLYVVGGSPTGGQTAPEVEILNLNNISQGWIEGPMLPIESQSFAMSVPTFYNNSRPVGALNGLVVVGPLMGTTNWHQNLLPISIGGYESNV